MSSDRIRNPPSLYHTSPAARRGTNKPHGGGITRREFSGRSRGIAWKLDTFDKAPLNGGDTTSELLKEAHA
jgi:hypothetical protein